MFDLMTRAKLPMPRNHMQRVTGFDYFSVTVAGKEEPFSFLATAGRDSVATIWRREKTSGKAPDKISKIRTVLAHEQLEGVVAAKIGDKIVLVTAGDRGLVRVWCPDSGKLLLERVVPHAAKGAVRLLERASVSGEVFVTGGEDHNLIYWKLTKEAEEYSLDIVGWYMGHCEEILCTQFVNKPGEMLVCASDDTPRLVDSETFRVRDSLRGHSQVVLCAAVAPPRAPAGAAVYRPRALTGSKDKSVRLWDLGSGKELARGSHAAAVHCVAFPNKADDCFLSGSADKCVTLWRIVARGGAAGAASAAGGEGKKKKKVGVDGVATGSDEVELVSELSRVAHEKDVNCMVFGPVGDKVFATGGGDKVIKLWSFPGVECKAEMKGHRRGIWTLAFHPTDKVGSRGLVEVVMVGVVEQLKVCAVHSSAWKWISWDFGF